jgi:hypothetical protein
MLSDGELLRLSELIESGGAITQSDARLLIGEVERLSEMVADCWLLIDALARMSDVKGGIIEAAQKLLIRHKAPGWKDKDINDV